MHLTQQDVILILNLIKFAWEGGGVTGDGAKERGEALLSLESKFRSMSAMRNPSTLELEKPTGTEKKPANGNILTEEPAPVEAAK